MQGIAMALLAPFSGRLSDRIQPRNIATTGCIVVTLGFLMLAQLDMHTTQLYIGGSLFLIGIGMGLFTSPNNNAVVSAVDPRDLGVATATMNLARVMGNLIGMGVVNLLMNLNLGDKQIIPIYYGLLESTISTAIIISLAYVLVGGFLSAMRGSSKANSG